MRLVGARRDLRDPFDAPNSGEPNFMRFESKNASASMRWHQEDVSHRSSTVIVMNSFRIRGLNAARFEHLFSLSPNELATHNARRVIATGDGFPCRVSLTDAQAGDEVILVNYEHHSVASPYRSSFAIFVRAGEEQFDAVNMVPTQLRKRSLSLRGYDHDGMMHAAELVEGRQLEEGLARLFEHSRIAYVHAHFAKHGCYAALIERH